VARLAPHPSMPVTDLGPGGRTSLYRSPPGVSEPTPMAWWRHTRQGSWARYEPAGLADLVEAQGAAMFAFPLPIWRSTLAPCRRTTAHGAPRPLKTLSVNSGAASPGLSVGVGERRLRAGPGRGQAGGGRETPVYRGNRRSSPDRQKTWSEAIFRANELVGEAGSTEPRLLPEPQDAPERCAANRAARAPVRRLVLTLAAKA